MLFSEFTFDRFCQNRRGDVVLSRGEDWKGDESVLRDIFCEVRVECTGWTTLMMHEGCVPLRAGSSSGNSVSFPLGIFRIKDKVSWWESR